MSRRNEAQGRYLVGFFFVASLLGLIWLYSQLTWTEKEIDWGFTEAAQRNHFLAAELFLNQLDIPTQSRKGVAFLDDLPPPEGGTLIMVTTSRTLGQQRLDNLWRWIEAGGHLITNVTAATNVRTGDIDDPLLAELGVGVYPVDEEAQAIGAVAPNWLTDMNTSWGSTTCLNEKDSFAVEIGDDQSIDIALRPNLYLVDHDEAAQASVANEHGLQLLQYDVGDGMVTVLAGLGLWSNGQIGCFDNAYLLWFLSEGEGVWILHHVEMPSLFRLMWDQAALALSLLALLLALWLWQRSRRFGPLLSADPTQRRSLLEHLHASAMFAWRHGHAEARVAELRQAIDHRMACHHAGFERLDFDAQCAAIAQITQQPPALVAEVMGPVNLKKPHRLVATVQGLQRIRNRL